MRIPFLGEVHFGNGRPHTLQEQVAEKLGQLDGKLVGRLLESIDLMANYVDPWERFRGADGEMWRPIGTMGGDDGRSATDVSNFTSDAELTQARDYCRLLARTNPFAINLHENLINYVVGEGHKYTIVAKKGEEVGDEDLKAIQDVLDEWVYESKWCCRQQESVLRFDRDGEYFRRFFNGPDGILTIRFVEPHQVYQPIGKQQKTNCFGIETDPDDTETVLAYWVDDERIEAEEIQHVKANVDANVRRGVPTTWPIGELLRKAVKVLNNIAVTSDIQTAIALIRRHMGATKSGLQNMRASAADWTVTNQTTGKTDYIERQKPGRIIDASANTEYDFPASGLDVAKYSAGVQAILRGAAARICFPEFMFTSDASNANYASTMVAEGPAVRMFQRRQKTQSDADLEVIWRVLDGKAEAGIIPADVLERIEVQIEPPTVQVRDALQETQINLMLSQSRILSPQTWSAKENLDYAQEQENLAQGSAPPAGELPPIDGMQEPATLGVYDQLASPTTVAVGAVPTQQQGTLVKADAGVQTDLTLSGAQILAAFNVLVGVQTGQLAPAAAVELLVSVGIPRQNATLVVNAQETLPPPVQPEPQVIEKPLDAANVQAREAAWTGYPFVSEAKSDA